MLNTKECIPIWAEEEDIININYIPKNEIWSSYLINQVLPDCIKNFEKKKLTLVDYGCGNAFLTNELYSLNKLQELKGKKIEIIGYEPDENLIKQTVDDFWEKRKKMLQINQTRGVIKTQKDVERFRNDAESYLNKIKYTSEKPEKEADIVLCHFSLHHAKEGIEKILKEEIMKKTNPQYLIIGEFDYKGNNVSIDDFQKLFLSTDAGKKELAEYEKKYGDNGLEICYEDHMKIGLQECVDVFKKTGYSIENIEMGNKNSSTQAMKFLIRAKKNNK